MHLMDVHYYEHISIYQDYLHPNIHTFIDHYRSGNLIYLPRFHDCNLVNRNGTRKLVRYEIGEQCVFPTRKRYWKKPKPKYGQKISFSYWARYMTQTRHRYLFKNR